MRMLTELLQTKEMDKHNKCKMIGYTGGTHGSMAHRLWDNLRTTLNKECLEVKSDPKE